MPVEFIAAAPILSKYLEPGRPIRATIQRFDTVQWDIKLVDEDNNSVNLTGCQVFIATTDKSGTILWLPQIIDPLAGTMRCVTQPRTVGRYELQARITSGNNDDTTFFLGAAVVALEDDDVGVTPAVESLTEELSRTVKEVKDFIPAGTALTAALVEVSNSAAAAATSASSALESKNTAISASSAAASSAADAQASAANAVSAVTSIGTAVSDSAANAQAAAEAAVDALTAKNGAADAASLAAQEAGRAASSAESALLSKDASAVSEANAFASKNAADTSATAAQAAKNAAETAYADADTARQIAVSASGTAVSAKNDAMAAKNAAQTSATNAASSETNAAASAAAAAASAAGLVVADATETAKGIAMLASSSEVTAGTDNTKIVTPAKLQSKINDIPEATTSAKGLMSPADKTKLDGVANGAVRVLFSNSVAETETQLLARMADGDIAYRIVG